MDLVFAIIMLLVNAVVLSGLVVIFDLRIPAPIIAMLAIAPLLIWATIDTGSPFGFIDPNGTIFPSLFDEEDTIEPVENNYTETVDSYVPEPKNITINERDLLDTNDLLGGI